MKIVLLVTTVLLGCTMKAQISVYHHFPDSSAIWNIHSSVAMSLCGPPVDQYYSITITGDTVISAKTYHKLFTPYVQVVPSFCTPLPAGYKGAIREDTLAKKVFYVAAATSSEQLLYDFTMQVGDTVRGFLETSSIPVDTVQSIDSVLVGATYRKRWNLSSWYNIHLIEGVGSTYGLLETSPGQKTDFPDYSITCFMENSQTLYPNTSTNCYLLTATNSIDKNAYQVNIFPNPASDQLFIETNVPDEINVDLFDINNKHVFSKTASDNSMINLSGLHEGYYNLTIKAADKIIHKKLIIAR